MGAVRVKNLFLSQLYIDSRISIVDDAWRQQESFTCFSVNFCAVVSLFSSSPPVVVVNSFASGSPAPGLSLSSSSSCLYKNLYSSFQGHWEGVMNSTDMSFSSGVSSVPVGLSRDNRSGTWYLVPVRSPASYKHSESLCRQCSGSCQVGWIFKSSLAHHEQYGQQIDFPRGRIEAVVRLINRPRLCGASCHMLFQSCLATGTSTQFVISFGPADCVIG